MHEDDNKFKKKHFRGHGGFWGGPRAPIREWRHATLKWPRYDPARGISPVVANTANT
jgi:hypothetical protein